MTNRPSDLILESLNGFSERKKKNVYNKEELHDMIVLFSNLFANKIKQGKVSVEDIESVENYVSTFLGIHKNDYFINEHEKLAEAAKTVLEADAMALEYLRQKEVTASSINDYSKGLRIH